MSNRKIVCWVLPIRVLCLGRRVLRWRTAYREKMDAEYGNEVEAREGHDVLYKENGRGWRSPARSIFRNGLRRWMWWSAHDARGYSSSSGFWHMDPSGRGYRGWIYLPVFKQWRKQAETDHYDKFLDVSITRRIWFIRIDLIANEHHQLQAGRGFMEGVAIITKAIEPDVYFS
ncbi:hypothetical protein EDB80DRAFT_783711 [Ilyonectria destructans]|nr:hypothetical protein EDB80DRAFT_783711 [Ilyonectria destructans]